MTIRFCLISVLISVLFSSLNAQVSGASYNCLGPFSLPNQNLGFINAVYTEGSESDFIYAGSLYGGLWKGNRTMEGDKESWNWKNITDTWKTPGTGIAALVVMPNTNGQVIYIGTQMGGNARIFAYGNGILKTENGGDSWKQVGPQIKPSEQKEVDYLEKCPQDPNIMIARIGREFYYTTDGWKSYSIIAPPIQNKDNNLHVADIEWKPGDKKTFYITTRCDGGIRSEFYATNDEGKTWKDMLHGIKAGNIQLDVINKKGYEELIYMMYADNGGFLQLYDGKNWSRNRNSSPVFNGSGYWNMQFEVNEEDTTVMYFSMTQVAKSVSAGKTFQTISDYWGLNTHADVRDLKILKASVKGTEDVIAMANDGGVSVSLPGAANSKSWKNVNGNGLAVAQFWGLGTSEKDPDLVMGGGQDNGIYTYDNGIWKNQTQGVGDGYDACISDLDPAFALGQGNSPSVFQTKNRGGSWTSVKTAPTQCHLFKRPMMKFGGAIWIGHHQLFKKDLSGGKMDAEWKQKSFIPDVIARDGGLMNNVINCFAIAEDGNTALLAYNGAIWQGDSLKGKLFFTKNLSSEKAEWRDLTKYTDMLNWREIMDMIPVPGEENSFYLYWTQPYNGFESEIVQLTVYADSIHLRDISFNAPKPRSRIVVENKTGNIYLATDTGVYFSNKALLNEKTWLPYFTSEKTLPFCTVADMEINYASNRLYLALYGRGIWYTPLAEYGSGETTNVSKNTEWTETKKITGPLIVGKKKTLVISAPLYLTGKSEILLKKGAKLVMRNKGGRTLLRNNDGSPYNFERIKKAKKATVEIE